MECRARVERDEAGQEFDVVSIIATGGSNAHARPQCIGEVHATPQGFTFYPSDEYLAAFKRKLTTGKD